MKQLHLPVGLDEVWEEIAALDDIQNYIMCSVRDGLLLTDMLKVGWKMRIGKFIVSIARIPNVSPAGVRIDVLELVDLAFGHVTMHAYRPIASENFYLDHRDRAYSDMVSRATAFVCSFLMLNGVLTDICDNYRIFNNGLSLTDRLQKIERLTTRTIDNGLVCIPMSGLLLTACGSFDFDNSNFSISLVFYREQRPEVDQPAYSIYKQITGNCFTSGKYEEVVRNAISMMQVAVQLKEALVPNQNLKLPDELTNLYKFR